MDFCFDLADQTVGDALRRIVKGLLGEAIALARAAPEPGQLHAIRKNIKMTRGLLRLVAPGLAAFRKEIAALRDAARLIAPHRDAEVTAEIVAQLSADSAVGAAAGIAAEFVGPDPETLRADLDTLAAALAEIVARVPNWRLDAKGFDAMEHGLRETWSACRNSLKKLQKRHDATSLHHWRGQIKTHWYHARLLQPIWPQMMAPHIAAADVLGELLGDHHDLSVLRAQLAKNRLSASAARALDDRLAKRQARAEHEIFALAERFLAEPAKPLAARWRRWWRLWRA